MAGGTGSRLRLGTLSRRTFGTEYYGHYTLGWVQGGVRQLPCGRDRAGPQRITGGLGPALTHLGDEELEVDVVHDFTVCDSA